MRHAVTTQFERLARIYLRKSAPDAGNFARRKRGMPQIKHFNMKLNHAEI